MPSALLALSLFAAAASAAKPWEPEENPCHWRISGANGAELRASIGQGDDDPVLTIADPAFLRISEEARPRVTLRVNGERRRTVRLIAWSSHVGTETAMLGMYLTASARRVLGGARRIEIINEGGVMVDLPLAQTPSRKVLDGCVIRTTGPTDSE